MVTLKKQFNDSGQNSFLILKTSKNTNNMHPHINNSHPFDVIHYYTCYIKYLHLHGNYPLTV